MTIVFIASDDHTLVTKHVDHIHISEVDDDDSTLYESTFFFLDGGMLVLATSSYAREHCGRFLGVISDGENPEQLRELADRETMNAAPVRMQ